MFRILWYVRDASISFLKLSQVYRRPEKGVQVLTREIKLKKEFPQIKFQEKHALSKREQKQKGTKILTVKVKIKSR